MRISINGKNIEVSDYLSDLVTKKVSKLDKLKDRQYEDWQTSVRKAEEERIEELVSQNYIRKTAG